mmetsp:Transcript_14455/g.42188  ORF Transcript_14455/g.42188 Transcript_14455/m.42188 type:complete len:96 (+) Transcript_14455:939-1226(+)
MEMHAGHVCFPPVIRSSSEIIMFVLPNTEESCKGKASNPRNGSNEEERHALQPLVPIDMIQAPPQIVHSWQSKHRLCAGRKCMGLFQFHGTRKNL